MWAVITIFVVTCTDESMDEEYHISYDRNRDMELAFAYMLFSLFWICQFLLATEEYIISAVITRWYEGNVPASTFALAECKLGMGTQELLRCPQKAAGCHMRGPASADRRALLHCWFGDLTSRVSLTEWVLRVSRFAHQVPAGEEGRDESHRRRVQPLPLQLWVPLPSYTPPPKLSPRNCVCLACLPFPPADVGAPRGPCRLQVRVD